MSGEGPAPEAWVIAELCHDWGALPFAGGVLEQPLGLLLMGSHLRAYAGARRTYEANPDNTPAAMRDLVLLTAKDSYDRRQS